MKYIILPALLQYLVSSQNSYPPQPPPPLFFLARARAFQCRIPAAEGTRKFANLRAHTYPVCATSRGRHTHIHTHKHTHTHIHVIEDKALARTTDCESRGTAPR